MDELAPPRVDAPASADLQHLQGETTEWVVATFGQESLDDLIERCDRFLEEAAELVQALGLSEQRAHDLVDYVYHRSAGVPAQEVGGVLMTLAALCSNQHITMSGAWWTELARDRAATEAIQKKNATKPRWLVA